MKTLENTVQTMDQAWEAIEAIENSANEEIERERKGIDEACEEAENTRRELAAMIDDVYAEKGEILEQLSRMSEQKISLASDNKHLTDKLKAERDKVPRLEASHKKDAQQLRSKEEEVRGNAGTGTCYTHQKHLAQRLRGSHCRGCP